MPVFNHLNKVQNKIHRLVRNHTVYEFFSVKSGQRLALQIFFKKLLNTHTLSDKIVHFRLCNQRSSQYSGTSGLQSTVFNGTVSYICFSFAAPFPKASLEDPSLPPAFQKVLSMNSSVAFFQPERIQREYKSSGDHCKGSVSELFTGPLRTQIIHASLLRILHQLQFCPISLPRHNPHPPHPPKKKPAEPACGRPHGHGAHEEGTAPSQITRAAALPLAPRRTRRRSCAGPSAGSGQRCCPHTGPARPAPAADARGSRFPPARPPPGGTRTAEAGRQLAPSSGGARRRRAARAEGEKKRKI